MDALWARQQQRQSLFVLTFILALNKKVTKLNEIIKSNATSRNLAREWWRLRESLRTFSVWGYCCPGSRYGDSNCFEQVVRFICWMTRVFIKQIADRTLCFGCGWSSYLCTLLLRLTKHVTHLLPHLSPSKNTLSCQDKQLSFVILNTPWVGKHCKHWKNNIQYPCPTKQSSLFPCWCANSCFGFSSLVLHATTAIVVQLYIGKKQSLGKGG